MKPSYGASKRYLWWSFWLAWSVIFLLIIGGLSGADRLADIAEITIPAMVAIVVCNLGVHRGFGSVDFWASNRRRRRNRNNQYEGWDE